MLLVKAHVFDRRVEGAPLDNHSGGPSVVLASPGVYLEPSPLASASVGSSVVVVPVATPSGVPQVVTVTVDHVSGTTYDTASKKQSTTALDPSSALSALGSVISVRADSAKGRNSPSLLRTMVSYPNPAQSIKATGSPTTSVPSQVHGTALVRTTASVNSSVHSTLSADAVSVAPGYANSDPKHHYWEKTTANFEASNATGYYLEWSKTLAERKKPWPEMAETTFFAFDHIPGWQDMQCGVAYDGCHGMPTLDVIKEVYANDTVRGRQV